MAESGTCNVCSAPCASCMHFNRLVTGIKTETSPGLAVCDNTSSQHSANKSVILNHVKTQSLDNLQDTASATSSHGSISESGQIPRSIASSSTMEVSNKFDLKSGEESLEGHDEYLEGVYSTITDKVNCSVYFNKSQKASAVNTSGVQRFVKDDNFQNLPYAKSEKDRKDSNISILPGSSSFIVPVKLEVSGFNFAQSTKGIPVMSNSDVSVKTRMETEVKTEKDSKYFQEESLSLDVVGASRGTSNDPSELRNEKEPIMESHSGDDSEEIIEHDVNICDICGDAGREDLLATCSGCSDGAEHTYCMQEKMEKVPDGEWFCEECRLAEKIRKQRDMVEETVKVQPYSRLRSINRNLSLKLDTTESYIDENRTDTYTRKRQLEKVESSTAFKRQAIESAKDVSVASSPHRLSREGSFKSIAREKVNKSLYQSAQGIHNPSNRPQKHKGSLSKSNSFNAASLKSKDKYMDDMSHNQKLIREPSDGREGASRLISRSLSIRPTHLGRPNASEPKVIMLSPKSSHAPEMKGFKKSKEHLSYDRKKVSRDERKPSMSSLLTSALDTDQNTGSCENGLVSSDYASRDSKAAQSDGKVLPVNKLIGHNTRNALDTPEKKLNKPHGKDERISGTFTATNHSSNVDTILNPELLPPQNASDQVKSTDNITTRSRQGKSISGSNLCLRCKEPNTAAHVCMLSSSKTSIADPSAVRISADDVDKMNPVKAALQAAFLKKPDICKKRRSNDFDQFDDQPVTPTLNGRHVPHDMWLSSNYTKNTSSTDKKQIEKSHLHSFSYVSGQESRINHLNHSFPFQESFSRKEVMLGSVASGDGKSITKALPNNSMSSTSIALTSTIPVREYIWQGDFEVNRNDEKVADMHPGFQAHLSTFASPNVMEVVDKLSPKLSLMEIPRISAWPAQFHATGATEDNVALYFFAKDIESYEKHYKIILDKMMRDDLALKGIVDGVELLIFPSSQLPQKSQRWNMLFFMWGVFRAKKHNCLTAGISRKQDTNEKTSIVASEASPYTPMPARPMSLADSKQLDCESVKHSLSGCSSSCGQPLSKWSSANSFGEEHIVGMDCEVQRKPRPGGDTTATISALMLGNQCTPVLEGSAIDIQAPSCDRQELNSVGSKGINYFGNDKKEVIKLTIEGKIRNEDSDIKPTLKIEPSMKDMSAKKYDFQIPFSDSDKDFSETLLAGSGSKDVTINCSSSDTHETGPSISSKKIMYDLNLDATDLLEETGTAEGFQSVVESTRVIDLQGANSNGWDLNSSANDVIVDCGSRGRQDPVLPSFDLALCAGTECFPQSNGALPLFVEMADTFEGGGRKKDAPAATLSLSLGLPFVDEKQQSSKQATTSAEQPSTRGKPPFVLFGGLAEK